MPDRLGKNWFKILVEQLLKINLCEIDQATVADTVVHVAPRQADMIIREATEAHSAGHAASRIHYSTITRFEADCRDLTGGNYSVQNHQ
jgi:hypothetical protein